MSLAGSALDLSALEALLLISRPLRLGIERNGRGFCAWVPGGKKARLAAYELCGRLGDEVDQAAW